MLESESHKQAKKIKKKSEIEADSTNFSSEFVAKDSSSDCSEFCSSDDNNYMLTINNILIQSRSENLKKGDFVLIKFEKKEE